MVLWNLMRTHTHSVPSLTSDNNAGGTQHTFSKSIYARTSSTRHIFERPCAVPTHRFTPEERSPHSIEHHDPIAAFTTPEKWESAAESAEEGQVV